MKCPVCGQNTEVVESRSRDLTTIRRRRCRKCDKLFYTNEEPMDYHEGSAKMLDIYNKKYKGVAYR